MVLFSEGETLLLLDLYAHLRLRPRNVTAGGVLLRQHARRRLARAMNKHFCRTPPWTESQLAVKIKNLRSEYSELRWLSQQPGYSPTGAGLTAAWWAAVKERRPKAHAFKGKLPWVFERRVALIVGDLPRGARVTTPATDKVIAQLMDELEAEDARAAAAAAAAAAQDPQQTKAAPPGRSMDSAITHIMAEQVDEDFRRQRSIHPLQDAHHQQQEEEEEEEEEEEQTDDPAPRNDCAAVDRAHENQSPLALGQDQRRRLEAALAVASIERFPAMQRESLAPSSAEMNGRRDESVASPPSRKRSRLEEREEWASRREKLANSVQQSSVAAAGMARGFQELVGVFQDQAARYRRLEGAPEGGGAEVERAQADQRRVVLSIARSLEQSTRATAEMALGFHDLVRLLVREETDR